MCMYGWFIFTEVLLGEDLEGEISKKLVASAVDL